MTKKKNYETAASKKAGIILEVTSWQTFECYCLAWYKATNAPAHNWEGWYIKKQLKTVEL